MKKKRNSLFKSDNYYIVHGFMISELGLSGFEKDVYAIIYGYSQAAGNRFTLGIYYLMDGTGISSRQTVYNALNSLLNKGYIDKETVELSDGTTRVEYWATRPIEKASKAVQNLDKETSETVQKLDKEVSETVQKLDTTVQKLDTTVQNLDNNCPNFRQDTLLYNKKEKKRKKEKDICPAEPDTLTPEQVSQNVSRKKSKSKQELIPDWFEEVWNRYPRKEGKSKITKEAYQELAEAGKDLILTCIQNFLDSRAGWDRKFIQMGSTFFNGSWKDFTEKQASDPVGAKPAYDKNDFSKYYQ